MLEDIQNMLGLKQKKKEESTEKDDDTAEMTEERLEDVITHKESKPPGMIKKFQKGYSYIPQKRYNSSRGIVAGIVGFLLLVSMPGFISWLKEPKPPAPEVVASYNDKTITVEELREFVKIEMAREMEHYICEEHGLDHSLCNPDESCETHPIDSIEGYRQLVEMMATEQIVLDWAEQQGITGREEVQHQLSDLFDDASVTELVKQIREKQMSMDTITNYEIQQYYDSNRNNYGDKAFSDVKEEIREILYAQKENEYLPAYIEQLKDEAGLEINYELLKKADQYELYENEALFDVHGKKYTLGDFMTEFKELSEEHQQAFEGYENKKILVDQLAVKELILEDGGDDAADGELNHDTEELKISYLYQIMHQEEIDEKIGEPTEEEIAEYYETYKSRFLIPESAKVKVIWIEETGDGKGKDKANKASEALKNGADFAEVAKQYSEDGSAENGGDVEGELYRNHLDAELAEMIFSLEAGEISDAALVHGGYYIFQLVSKQAEEQKALEEVKEDIISHINDERHHELEAEMEDMLLEQSNLIIYEKTLRKMMKEVEESNGTEK